MYFTIRIGLSRYAAFVVLGAATLSAAWGGSASAGAVYIEQSQRIAGVRQYAIQSQSSLANPASPQAIAPSPTTVTPITVATANIGGNLALTTQIGRYNAVYQFQYGANNRSNVGIVGGTRNSAVVLQSGNSLRSNLVLVNTTGLSVGVLQPSGSTPVNMLIARLPNGGLLIKR